MFEPPTSIFCPSINYRGGLGAVNPVDNSLVYVHRLETDYGELCKAVQTTEYLSVYFAFCEYMHQCVLRQVPPPAPQIRL